MQIKYLKAFADNYIWLIIHQQQIIVVDPGESYNVLNYIIDNNLRLKAILLTHDHSDHVSGVEDILAHYQVPVYGNCNYATINIVENECIKLFDDIGIKVIITPGHTYNSVCYMIEHNEQKCLFCGDTLFASGCGRVFTNDYYAMYQSLLKIKSLDTKTLIYPAHEYTLKNIDFALHLMPSEQMLDEYYKQCKINYQLNHTTLPTTLVNELKFNPFLKLDDTRIISCMENVFNVSINSNYDCFKYLRMYKNNF